jgi:hypothetical protein
MLYSKNGPLHKQHCFDVAINCMNASVCENYVI